MAISFRTLFFGGAFLACGFAGVLTTLTACESLSQTSPLPPSDASDLDAGAPPPEPEEASVVVPDTGPPPVPPASGRLRLANFLEGSPKVDLCVKPSAPANAPWEPGWITGTAALFSGPPGFDGKDDGLAYGEVSQSAFVSAAPGSGGSGYLFRVVPVGSACDGADATILAGTTAASILRQGAGLTIYIYGRVQDGVDAGDANPKIAVIGDNLAPAGTSTQFRVVHAISDVAAFDVVINGDTVLQGIRYGTAYTGPPYATVSATAPPPSGFASIAAGVDAESTLTLRSGTTVRSFTIPNRLRRGVATTVFAGGRRDALQVQLCSDRTPEDGDVANCQKLVPQE